MRILVKGQSSCLCSSSNKSSCQLAKTQLSDGTAFKAPSSAELWAILSKGVRLSGRQAIDSDNKPIADWKNPGTWDSGTFNNPLSLPGGKGDLLI